MYQMTTIYNGTRIRDDHNTYGNVLASVNANITVTGTEVWVATSDGAEVRVNDKWLRVTYNGVAGWMAYVHKGYPICKNLVEISDAPVLNKDFPEYFTLESPTGERKRYNRVD